MSTARSNIAERFDSKGGFENLREVDSITKLRMKEEAARHEAQSSLLIHNPASARAKVPKMDLAVLIFLFAFATYLAVNHFQSGGNPEVVHCRDLGHSVATGSK